MTSPAWITLQALSLEVGAFAVVGAVAFVLVAAGLWLHVRRRRRVGRALGDPQLVARITGEELHRVPWLRVLSVGAASALLAIALADPRWGTAEEVEAGGGTVVLVLDASISMLAADLAPSRLERAREAARTIAAALPTSAIGIVAFAGRAYAVAPPTPDPGAIDLYIEALHPDMVSQTGSSLASAVRQGVAVLIASDRSRGGSLVVVSDGDSDEEATRLSEAAELASRAGVPVHVLGAGTPSGAVVPDLDFETGREAGVLRDAAGDPVVTRLQEAKLRELAAQTGGMYLPLSASGAADAVAEEIRRNPGPAYAPDAEDDPTGHTPTPRFAWFALLALALLVWEAAPRSAGRTR